MMGLKVKIWLISAIAFVLLVIGFVVVALYRNLNTEWSYQYVAAQNALNQSPITHISAHSTFTDMTSEEVFKGQDIFGRYWYAFVSGPPWVTEAVPANQIVSKAQIESAAKKALSRQISVHLGYLSDSTDLSFKVPNHVVWEVYGTVNNGKHVYLYYDGETGKLLWKYML